MSLVTEYKGAATAIPSGMLCTAIATASGIPTFNPIHYYFIFVYLSSLFNLLMQSSKQLFLQGNCVNCISYYLQTIILINLIPKAVLTAKLISSF